MNSLEDDDVFYFPAAENRESDNNTNQEAIIKCANNEEEAICFSQNEPLAAAAASSIQQMNFSTGYLTQLLSFDKGQSSAHKTKLLRPFDSLQDITDDGAKEKKKNRSAEAHSLSERLRRQKLKAKIDALREVIPNCDKTDVVIRQPIQTTQLVDEEDK